jgi:hypothetical protein
MGTLSNALQQLREERKQMQANVEKLDRAILVIESLNCPAATRSATAHMTEDGYVKHRMLEIRVRFPSTVIRTAHQVA